LLDDIQDQIDVAQHPGLKQVLKGGMVRLVLLYLNVQEWHKLQYY
jgi:hypothetical protein